MTKRIAAGLGAIIALTAILVGLPASLIAIAGVGLPHVEWSPAGIWQALLRPDDGTLALTLLKVAGWVLWAVSVAMIGVEIVARLRHVRPPRLPALAIPQGIVRTLVTAAVTLFVATSAPTSPKADTAVALAETAPRAQPAPGVEPGTQELHQYTVRKGDTLSEIALDHLGNGHRYPAIFDASRNIRQPDGRRLTDPDFIDIGWKVNIPTKANGHTKPKSADPAPPPSVTATATTPPAAPVPAPPAATAARADSDVVDTDQDATTDYQPPWLVTGLAGSGAILAGSLWLVLSRRRAFQRRHRRPGRMIHLPPPNVIPIEKTLRSRGMPLAETITTIDETLRRLAATLIALDRTMPDLAALEATPSLVRLHLANAAEPPEPWSTTEEGLTWQLDLNTDTDQLGPLEPDSAAPWQQLATIGQTDDGTWWLLNLEHYGTINLTGDPDYVEDLARYLATELATAPWARDLTIDLIGTCPEVAGINDTQLHAHTDPDAIDEAVRFAVDIVDRGNHTNTPDVATGRVRYDGDELWESRTVITPATSGGHLTELLNLITQLPSRTATSAILIGEVPPETTNLTITLGANGRLRIPDPELDLVATGLTADEAAGCVMLIQAANTIEDDPPPVSDDRDGWRGWADETGNIRREHTLPRDTDPDETVTALTAPDEQIIAETANLPEDLDRIARRVPAATAEQIVASDPTLDADLADWHAHSSDRPRLSVLGPVNVRVGRGGEPLESARRRPYYTEIVAYLATKPRGATTADICGAFLAGPERMRKDLTAVRKWLGTDPKGQRYLPESIRDDDVHQGKGRYVLRNLLCDADLFRRLRIRAASKGDAGLPDLMAALHLVRGEPYAELHNGGGVWFADSRDDQNLVVAILDASQTAVTMALMSGDLDTARTAASIAAEALPDEESPLLNLAVIAQAEGQPAVAVSAIRKLHEASDSEGRIDPSVRAADIMRRHGLLSGNQTGSFRAASAG